jgi:hypothetical protein
MANKIFDTEGLTIKRLGDASVGLTFRDAGGVPIGALIISDRIWLDLLTDATGESVRFHREQNSA